MYRHEHRDDGHHQSIRNHHTNTDHHNQQKFKHHNNHHYHHHHHHSISSTGRVWWCTRALFVKDRRVSTSLRWCTWTLFVDAGAKFNVYEFQRQHGNIVVIGNVF